MSRHRSTRARRQPGARSAKPPLRGLSQAQPLRGLPPIAGRRVHTLILGSLPGVASLEACEYYDHPRNGFWDAAESLGIARSLPYRSRCARLKHLGFALWDVLAECERMGSLDQAIRAPRPNDLPVFAGLHPELRSIWLNGAAAQRYFARFALAPPGVSWRTLPSTNPANTARHKLAVWRRAFRGAARRAHADSPERVLARRFGAA